VQRRFTESPGAMLFGLAFFGGGFLFIAWVLFVRGTEGGTPLFQLGWLMWGTLIGSAGMTLAVLARLTVVRKRIQIEDDHLRHGDWKLHTLRREVVSDLTIEDGEIAHLHLVDPEDQAVRREAGVVDRWDAVQLPTGIYINGDKIIPALEEWLGMHGRPH
jgi:hypothetical protein